MSKGIIVGDTITFPGGFTARYKKAAPLPAAVLPPTITGDINWDKEPCCTDERDCQTWHSPAWVNREQVWSIRGECWIWKPIPKVVDAKSKVVTTDDILDSWDLEAAMHLRDDKVEAAWLKSMQNWTPDEVDGLLSR